MRFRDLVERIAADRVIELVADAAEAVRAAGLATIAERRSAYEDAAAARRAAHDVDLAERWTPASVEHAQRIIRDRHDHHRGDASRWVAGQAGLSLRTARRWLSPDVPAGRIAQVIDLARQIADQVAAEFEAAAEHERAEFIATEAQQLAELDQEVAEAAAEAEAAAHAQGAALAAPVIAGYTGVSVGSVSVEYDGDDDGVRHLDADYDLDFEAIASTLSDHGLDAAEQQFDSAVLDAYDIGGNDLGTVLDVADFTHLDLH
uniref:hypothetical protein n=1 Tax=Saccharothrix espanaensis TaxID=103731 RepID=UPI003F495EF7